MSTRSELSEARNFEIQVNGLRLAGLSWGDPHGLPTLALHGWLDNAATFARLAPELPELNIVALDFAGHGLSDHRGPGVHYMSMLDVQDAMAVANALGWEKFRVLGHSMGAGVASEMCGLFPNRIEHAVMIDGFVSPDSAADSVERNREALERMLRLAEGPARMPMYESTEAMVERVTAATDQSPEAARVLVERGHQQIEAGFTWRTDPRIRFPTPARHSPEEVDELMKRSHVHSLLIVANSGDRWYRDGVPRRQALHPDLTVEHMDGPHHVHLEPAHYREVAQRVRGFMDL